MIEIGKIDLLEQKHAMKVLLVLKGKRMFKGELASMITISTGAVQARVQELVECGLVIEEPQSVKPFKKMVSLTEKGEEVAALVEQINMLL